MKKLSLIAEFNEVYKGSDLQKIVSHNPLPIKYTINGTDCYFYNADLFGLFEWKIKKDGLATNDFIDDYKKGFEAGLLHLETSERIELKDLKSKDLREGTISQLQYILFEREFKTGSKGLLDLVFNKLPLIFTEKVVYDFGYWNGIIYSIDELCEKAGIKTNDLKALPPQQSEKPKPEPKETKLSERIKTHFGFFSKNCPRKHKQILNDTDFDKLIKWTISYFENGFEVPEISEPIKVVNTNKTFVQLAFKYLFKELHKSSPYPETLFEFYRSAFNPYSEDKKSNFEAVKNNDEVKKLMQIDY